MLNEVKEGQIFYQLAIVEEEKLENGKISLSVNDATGIINQPLKIDRQEFDQCFAAHPRLEGHYFRRVQVESISGNNIFFVNLDKKGMPHTSARGILKDLFANQFLYADQIGLS